MQCSDILQILLKGGESLDQDPAFLFGQRGMDGIYNTGVEILMMPEGGFALLGERYENNTTVCFTAGSKNIFLSNQSVDGNGQRAHGDAYLLGKGGHIDFVVKTDGIDDMHVIDGDILEGVPDNSVQYPVHDQKDKQGFRSADHNYP